MALDFLAGKAEEHGEKSFQDRMVKAPLKAVDLANVLKGVDRVVKETPKFTATMGEKPEKVVGFILEILGKLQLRNSEKRSGSGGDGGCERRHHGGNLGAGRSAWVRTWLAPHGRGELGDWRGDSGDREGS